MKQFFVIAIVGVTFLLSVTSCKYIARYGSQKIILKIAKELVETGEEKTLKELATSSKVLRLLYNGLEQRLGRDFVDNVVVRSAGDDVLELYSKNFPTSRVYYNLRTNTMEGAAGSLQGAGPVNEFFNVMLPNMHYKIDGCFSYTTDRYGRVIYASSDRSKAMAIQRNPRRNSDIQRDVVEQMDGQKGVDDAGHLFANNTGGPNEMINQVPMLRDINRNGDWRKIELLEEDALKAGKNVISQRKLLYKGRSKKPYAIGVTIIIDNRKYKQVIKLV